MQHIVLFCCLLVKSFKCNKPSMEVFAVCVVIISLRGIDISDSFACQINQLINQWMTVSVADYWESGTSSHCWCLQPAKNNSLDNETLKKPVIEVRCLACATLTKWTESNESCTFLICSKLHFNRILPCNRVSKNYTDNFAKYSYWSADPT